MKYHSGLKLIPSLLAVSLGAAATAADFSDLAEVVAVDPIVDRVYEPVRQRRCGPPEPPPLLPPARNLAQDILRQQSLVQPPVSCRWVEEETLVRRVSGYRVTYRYDGREYLRSMQEPPGEFLPVRVALEPLR